MTGSTPALSRTRLKVCWAGLESERYNMLQPVLLASDSFSSSQHAELRRHTCSAVQCMQVKLVCRDHAREEQRMDLQHICRNDRVRKQSRSHSKHGVQWLLQTPWFHHMLAATALVSLVRTGLGINQAMLLTGSCPDPMLVHCSHTHWSTLAQRATACITITSSNRHSPAALAARLHPLLSPPPLLLLLWEHPATHHSCSGSILAG